MVQLAHSSLLPIYFPKCSFLFCHGLIKKLSLFYLSSSVISFLKWTKFPGYGWETSLPFSWYQAAAGLYLIFTGIPTSPTSMLMAVPPAATSLSARSACAGPKLPSMALPRMVWSPLKMSLFVHSLYQYLSASIINKRGLVLRHGNDIKSLLTRSLHVNGYSNGVVWYLVSYPTLRESYHIKWYHSAEEGEPISWRRVRLSRKAFQGK